MGKERRYKRRKKRLSNFLVFYVVVATLSIILYTFSRYTSVSDSDLTVKIADFSVKVNDIFVGTGNSFTIALSPNSTAYGNKIIPDSEGYFQLDINPAGTEVALEYEFHFNLGNDYNIQLTNCSTDGGKTKITIPEEDVINNVVKGTIELPKDQNGNRTAFTKENEINLRVYWKWEEDIINPKIDNTEISVKAIIKQKIN